MDLPRGLARAALVLVAATTVVAAGPKESANYSDIWWNPAESGWGLTISDHESNLFAVHYAYREDGQPAWYVIPGGTFSADRRFFQGDLYRTSGPVHSAEPFSPSAVTVARVGTARFDFAAPGLAAGAATYTYQIGDLSRTKPIERQPFGSAAPAWRSDFTDIWWDPQESGWGLSISQHGDNLFGVLFTYGSDNQPLWVVMPGGQFIGDSRFTASLYTTTGTPLGAARFDPSATRVSLAGVGELRFAGDSGVFTYSIRGTTRTKAIERQPFGSMPARPCEPGTGICLATADRSASSPLAPLRILGAGFDPSRSGLSVRFRPRDGRPPVEVPATFATPTAVDVVVPPLIGIGSPGSSAAGLVDVQVIRVTGTAVTTSNAMRDPLLVQALPAVTSSPGAMTATFLRAAANISAATQAAIHPPYLYRASLATMAGLEEGVRDLLPAIDRIANGQSASEAVPLASGANARIDAGVLRLADQLSLAAVASLTARAGSEAAFGKAAYDDCPVSARDPVAYDTDVCRLQRALQNAQRRLATSEMQELAWGTLFGPLLGLAVTEGIGAGLAADLVATGLGSIVASGLASASLPPGTGVLESLGAEIAKQLTGADVDRLKTAVLAFDAIRASFSEFPGAPILLSHSLLVSDGRGNSRLVLSDGSSLVRVPDAPGTADRSRLVATSVPCTFAYSDYGACQPDNTQLRSVISSAPAGCTGSPSLTRACTYTNPGGGGGGGGGGGTACSYTYSNFGACEPSNTQSRTVLSSTPPGCTGTPSLVQACDYSRVQPKTCTGTYSLAVQLSAYGCPNNWTFNGTASVTGIDFDRMGPFDAVVTLSGITDSFQGAPDTCTPVGLQSATGSFVGAMTTSRIGTGTLSIIGETLSASFSVGSLNTVLGVVSGDGLSGRFSCRY